MNRISCPHCGTNSVVDGQMSTGDERSSVPRFSPNQMRSKLFSAIRPLEIRCHACLACGSVWSTVDPQALRSLIVTHGSELAVQEIDELEGGPMRGLLDTTLARQVAANVAEIDHLVRSDKTNEAVRRYRDLAGVTWDQALAATRSWRDLRREEKLARFGWVAKKAGMADDLADPLI